MNKSLVSIIILIWISIQVTAQVEINRGPLQTALFRSGTFLHHSTGANIWGPNGSNTSIPQEMAEYNNAHGYTGSEAVAMNEEWYPANDNEWVTWHNIFEDPNPSTGIGGFLPDNPVIVIKSCFPSSSMTGSGEPSDTLDPGMKTVYNYKWHWRHIVEVIRSYPENFFAIWTNAPLEPYSTNPTEAALSNWFCTWAKDTLAMGLDPATGAFPANAYVFDFFHKLTGPNGMMLSSYAAGAGDSHPNAAATELVAPQFVSEIFEAAINYETLSAVPEKETESLSALRVLPNPCKTSAGIFFSLPGERQVSIDLYNISGQKIGTLYLGRMSKGDHQVAVPVPSLQSGSYQLVIGTNLTRNSLPLIILK